MSLKNLPSNSTANITGSEDGHAIGEMVNFSSLSTIDKNPRYVPCNGDNFSWSEYPQYAIATNNVAPAFKYDATLVTSSEPISNNDGAIGAYKGFGTATWLMPSTGNDIVVRVISTTWSGASPNDQAFGTAVQAVRCTSRSDHGGEGMLITYNVATSTIAYTTATTLSSGWAEVDLNSIASIAASSTNCGTCNSGASGRWYTLWRNGTALEMAYSGVDTVNTGWTKWGGTVTHGGGTISNGSISVKEGSRWMWSGDGITAPGRIYGATSLGGAASLLLDVSPNRQLWFYLSYDPTDDIFMAIPSFYNHFIYTSSDDGVTWLKGDRMIRSARHEAVKYSDASSMYIVPHQSSSASYPFVFIKLDSEKRARIISAISEDSLNIYETAFSGNTLLAINPDTSIAIAQSGGTTTHDIVLDTDIATEFTTPAIFNFNPDSDNSGVPIVHYPAIKVKK